MREPYAMVYAPHFRITARGVIGPTVAGALEQFSISLNMTGEQYPVISPAALADIRDDIVAFWQRPESKINNYARLTMVKAAPIGADGRYAGDPVFDDTLDVPGAGPGSPSMPPQVSLAISLETDRRGPSGRGRFYLPMPNVALDTGMTLSDADQATIGTSVAQLLIDLDNLPGPDLSNPLVVVASSKGFNTAVTGVRVGQVLDTVRSRRRSLPEKYSTTAPVA